VQQIEVGRWLFWCAVLLLVVTIVFTILISGRPDQMFPLFDTGLNLVVTLLWAVMLLFLFASVAPKTDARSHVPGETNAPPPVGR
jgi:hypothetical protein